MRRREPARRSDRNDMSSTRIGRALLLALAASPVAACASSTAFERVAHDTLSTPAAGQRLEIRNTVGDVTLVADPASTEIRAEVTLKGKGSSPARAEDALDDIDVSLLPGNAGTIVAQATHPDGGHGKNYEVAWKITAPPAMIIAITNDVGDIDVGGFTSGLVVANDVGNVTIRNVLGGTKVSTDVGDIGLTGSAPVDASSDVGDVNVTVLPGSVGPITLGSDVGTITLTMPAVGWGEVNASTGTGDARVSLAGMIAEPLRIDDDEFRAKLNDGTGPKVQAKSGVGDVSVKFSKAGQ
jgi:hypothetical protein